jgi:dTDP-4-dehydrorhamnose reductase
VRILIFGGWGQLGSDLVAAAAGLHEVIRPRHREVDIADPGAVLGVARDLRPDVLINAAAYHKVELCEQYPDRAFAVNAVGAAHVAQAAAAVRARCVYISTDYVFDGENPQGYSEDHPVDPVNLYGLSKAAGEWAVRIADEGSLVVRASALFGHAGSSGKGGNFVENMLAKALAGQPISVVDDQFTAPTCTRDMAERILLWLGVGAAPGIYHAANSGSCSWFLFCKQIFELARVEADLTRRATGVQQIRRPRWSVLIDSKSELLGLPPNRHWKDALAWYLNTRSSASLGVARTTDVHRTVMQREYGV